MLKNLATDTGYYSAEKCDLNEFSELISMSAEPSDVPRATEISCNVPIYEVASLSGLLSARETRCELMAEWARVLHSGAGAFVLKQAQPDHEAINRASECYLQIIEHEKEANKSGADHFAAAGSNDRVWNSLQKLCEKAPATFVRYFASPAIDAACEAWLGPNYQMTAQVNLVHPGGKAQQAHRDYHLGFQTAEISGTYPAHVHDLSPLLTLQGAIAHCDMPVESGPTKLLPFSQQYRPGYAAWRRDDFRACFEENHVQLPLEKGDALFFNPALFHAAGENASKNIERMANLVQVSSAFGRAMEHIDRAKMCAAAFGALKSKWQSGDWSALQFDAVLGSLAEGYSFPTNLDNDPPVGGLAPRTQKQILKEAVTGDLEATELKELLAALTNRQKA